MTKWGETNGFCAGDFAALVERYIKPGALDYVLANTRRPAKRRLARYARESAEFVEPIHLPQGPKPLLADLLQQSGEVRYDERRLARILLGLVA
jgi:hypothetical protein